MEKDKSSKHKYTTLDFVRFMDNCDSYDEYEKKFNNDLIIEESSVGSYLQELLWKYDKKAYKVSQDAGVDRSYVGNIVNGKKNLQEQHY